MIFNSRRTSNTDDGGSPVERFQELCQFLRTDEDSYSVEKDDIDDLKYILAAIQEADVRNEKIVNNIPKRK